MSQPNLKDLAKELLEKAAKATPGPYTVGEWELVDGAKTGNWYVRTSGADFVNEFNESTSKYIAAASPDVIAALARAYLEQAERLEKLEAAHLEARELVEKLTFALQCMIINKNGAVPGLTDQQVFDDAVDVRDEARAFLSKYGLGGEK